jgi:hypothetical protein
MPDELRPLSTDEQEKLTEQGWLIDPTIEQVNVAEEGL